MSSCLLQKKKAEKVTEVIVTFQYVSHKSMTKMRNETLMNSVGKTMQIYICCRIETRSDHICMRAAQKLYGRISLMAAFTFCLRNLGHFPVNREFRSLSQIVLVVYQLLSFLAILIHAIHAVSAGGHSDRWR